MKRTTILNVSILILSLAVMLLCLMAWEFKSRPPLNPEVDAVAILPDGRVISQEEFMKIVHSAMSMGDDELKVLNKKMQGTQIRNFKTKFERMEP